MSINNYSQYITTIDRLTSYRISGDRNFKQVYFGRKRPLNNCSVSINPHAPCQEVGFDIIYRPKYLFFNIGWSFNHMSLMLLHAVLFLGVL